MFHEQRYSWQDSRTATLNLTGIFILVQSLMKKVTFEKSNMKCSRGQDTRYMLALGRNALWIWDASWLISMRDPWYKKNVSSEYLEHEFHGATLWCPECGTSVCWEKSCWTSSDVEDSDTSPVLRQMQRAQDSHGIVPFYAQFKSAAEIVWYFIHTHWLKLGWVYYYY